MIVNTDILVPFTQKHGLWWIITVLHIALLWRIARNQPLQRWSLLPFYCIVIFTHLSRRWQVHHGVCRSQIATTAIECVIVLDIAKCSYIELFLWMCFTTENWFKIKFNCTYVMTMTMCKRLINDLLILISSKRF